MRLDNCFMGQSRRGILIQISILPEGTTLAQCRKAYSRRRPPTERFFSIGLHQFASIRKSPLRHLATRILPAGYNSVLLYLPRYSQHGAIRPFSISGVSAFFSVPTYRYSAPLNARRRRLGRSMLEGRLGRPSSRLWRA